MSAREKPAKIQVTLGLRTSNTVRQTVLWADELLFCDLSGADLSDLNLTGKTFIGCVLSGCSFRSASLDDVCFRTCVAGEQSILFEYASTTNICLENCNFSAPDGTIHPVWEDFTDAILAAASGESEDLLYDVCNPDHLDADEKHEAAVFFAAQAFYADNPRLRVEAIECFGNILKSRPDVVGSSLDALVALVALRAGDWHADVHHEAFTVVGELNPGQRASELLYSLLHCPDRTIRLDVFRSLDELVSRLNWYDSVPRANLLQSLIYAEEEGDTDILNAILSLWYDQVRTAGINDRDEASRLSEVLTRLLDNPHSEVRRGSLRVLSRFFSWDVRDRIVPLLQDDDPEVREHAWRTLYELTDQGPALRAFVLKYPPSARARDYIASESAALRESGQPGILGTANELAALTASPDPEKRRQGIYLLGLVKDPGQNEILIKHLADENPQARLEALRAIVRLDMPGAAQAIEPLLTDANDAVQNEAAQALNRLRRAQADPKP